MGSSSYISLNTNYKLDLHQGIWWYRELVHLFRKTHTGACSYRYVSHNVIIGSAETSRRVYIIIVIDLALFCSVSTDDPYHIEHGKWSPTTGTSIVMATLLPRVLWSPKSGTSAIRAHVKAVSA